MYMIAVCISVYTIMFKVYITALACFDGYVRAATLIANRLRIAFTLITDSCYWNLASLYNNFFYSCFIFKCKPQTFTLAVKRVKEKQ